MSYYSYNEQARAPQLIENCSQANLLRLFQMPERREFPIRAFHVVSTSIEKLE